MTFSESASAMRRVADAFDKLGGQVKTGKPKPGLEGDIATGAAWMLVYLRDLITNSNVEFDSARLLVLLETITHDDEIFPCGVARVLWQLVDEEPLDDLPNR